METKNKIKECTREARECLKRLASGGIIGVENCQYVAILWGKLMQVEGLCDKIADGKEKDEQAGERMEE